MLSQYGIGFRCFVENEVSALRKAVRRIAASRTTVQTLWAMQRLQGA
jgi:hypothetical protein